MSIVILEGTDHIGKTTLANKLEASGWIYHHFGVPSVNWDYFYDFIKFIDGLDKTKHHVIDRFHLGGLVYGRILRLHTQKVELERYTDLKEILNFLGASIHIFYANDEDWLENHLFQSKKAELYSGTMILRANRVYRWLAESGKYANSSWAVNASGWPSDFDGLIVETDPNGRS